MTDFKSFALPELLQKSLEKLEFDKATEVQAQAVPSALEGKDIIISAPTGTGKTLAFCVPIITNMLLDDHYQAIIVTPTRELSTQISEVVRKITANFNHIKTALLIGGSDMGRQLKQLQSGARLIVGTPGRINDHLKRRSLKLDQTKMLVLDEMDRMLDMGFSIQIDDINKFLPKEKQVLMLSATIPPTIISLANKYLRDPLRITVKSEKAVNSDITETFIKVAKQDKYKTLVEKMEESKGSVIIFVKTRINADDLSKKLNNDFFKTRAIHGGLRQNQREKLIRQFRQEEFSMLVATDVAARGIDVSHVEHVVNYNLPTNPEDYVHRVGRTGRAGKKGHSICLISPSESKEWRALECFLDPSKKGSQGGGGNSGGRSGDRRRSGGGGGYKGNGSSRGFRGNGNRDDRREGSSRPSRDGESRPDRRGSDNRSSSREGDNRSSSREGDNRSSSRDRDNRSSNRAGENRTSSRAGENRTSSRDRESRTPSRENRSPNRRDESSSSKPRRSNS